MRMISVFAVLAATPTWAHEASIPHAHSEWALPVGLCLIGLGAVFAGAKAYVRVRK